MTPDDLGLPEAQADNVTAPRQNAFDSAPETKAHIRRVQELMFDCADRILARRLVHDDSKLLPPEKEMFDSVTGKLRGMTYGSDEYRQSLAELGPALQHHYAHNSHHPEHYVTGVDGMSLLDLIEMLCDWKAAGERHADGSISRSLKVNRERFKIGAQLQNILENSAVELDWMKKQEVSTSVPAPSPALNASGVAAEGESGLDVEEWTVVDEGEVSSRSIYQGSTKIVGGWYPKPTQEICDAHNSSLATLRVKIQTLVEARLKDSDDFATLRAEIAKLRKALEAIEGYALPAFDWNSAVATMKEIAKLALEEKDANP